MLSFRKYPTAHTSPGPAAATPDSKLVIVPWLGLGASDQSSHVGSLAFEGECPVRLAFVASSGARGARGARGPVSAPPASASPLLTASITSKSSAQAAQVLSIEYRVPSSARAGLPLGTRYSVLGTRVAGVDGTPDIFFDIFSALPVIFRCNCLETQDVTGN